MLRGHGVKTTRELDLPLEDTASNRFLVWIIAGLTYVMVLAFALAGVSDGAVKLHELRPKMVTVALPPGPDDARGAAELEAALAVLHATEGVRAASPVSKEELERLIEAWIGSPRPDDALALPRLIDVTFDASRELDVGALSARLRDAVAGASVDVDEVKNERAEEIARLLRTGGGSVGLVILLGMLGLVVVVTRMSLDRHDQTVDLLRMMGAADGYVARQFELHALLNGLRGGLAGFAAAFFTLLVVVQGGRLIERLAAMPLGLRAVDWVLLACVPIIAAMLITATARATALWGLGRLR